MQSSIILVYLGISSLTGSDVSSGHHSSKEPKLREQLTMIPESVLAALTNIQRNQLRRVREDASNYLESILRDVVKIVDVYYADQTTKELLIPPKKMIGDEGLELFIFININAVNWSHKNSIHSAIYKICKFLSKKIYSKLLGNIAIFHDFLPWAKDSSYW